MAITCLPAGQKLKKCLLCLCLIFPFFHPLDESVASHPVWYIGSNYKPIIRPGLWTGWVGVVSLFCSTRFIFSAGVYGIIEGMQILNSTSTNWNAWDSVTLALFDLCIPVIFQWHVPQCKMALQSLTVLSWNVRGLNSKIKKGCKIYIFFP